MDGCLEKMKYANKQEQRKQLIENGREVKEERKRLQRSERKARQKAESEERRRKTSRGTVDRPKQRLLQSFDEKQNYKENKWRRRGREECASSMSFPPGWKSSAREGVKEGECEGKRKRMVGGRSGCLQEIIGCATSNVWFSLSGSGVKLNAREGGNIWNEMMILKEKGGNRRAEREGRRSTE
jgi:hypothetical protein